MREREKKEKRIEGERETREHRRRTKMNGVNNMWHISKISAHCSQFLHPRQIGERSRFACLLKVATGGNLTSADADRSRALPKTPRNKTATRRSFSEYKRRASVEKKLEIIHPGGRIIFRRIEDINIQTETDFTSKVL